MDFDSASKQVREKLYWEYLNLVSLTESIFPAWGWFQFISDIIVVLNSGEIFSSSFYISITVNFGEGAFLI